MKRRRLVFGALLAAAGAATGQAQRRTGAVPAPRAVTRGESTKQAQRVKVDWLNCTFEPGGMTISGLVGFLGNVTGLPVVGNENRAGLFGFEHRVDLRAYVGAVMADIGCIAYGGESQRGRWLLQLTGKGCGLVKDWESLQELLEGLGATITRVDLAADFLDGEHTVDDAVVMHRNGEFNLSGRPPSTSVAGDWLECMRGRTLYVGKTGNGKQLCVYEKGKQLGDLDSSWVRFELRLGNRDRVIPFDTLTQGDKFFAGAYPALAALLQEAGEAIPTTQTEAATTLGHLLYHMKRCFGKALHQAQACTSVNNTDLVEEIRIVGIPRRVKPSGVVAGLSWGELQSQIRRE
jgi:phage replication initiation protein